MLQTYNIQNLLAIDRGESERRTGAWPGRERRGGQDSVAGEGGGADLHRKNREGVFLARADFDFQPALDVRTECLHSVYV